MDCGRSRQARDFHPHYGGDVKQRDGGYHQGAVWGWLLGQFALAAFRVTGDSLASKALLEPMRDTLADQGLGTIGKIFDGEHRMIPGRAAQAGSVACTCRHGSPGAASWQGNKTLMSGVKDPERPRWMRCATKARMAALGTLCQRAAMGNRARRLQRRRHRLGIFPA